MLPDKNLIEDVTRINKDDNKEIVENVDVFNYEIKLTEGADFAIQNKNRKVFLKLLRCQQNVYYIKKAEGVRFTENFNTPSEVETALDGLVKELRKALISYYTKLGLS